MVEKSAASKSLTSGALAGFASVIFLQPLDVVKTRLQEQPASASTFSTRLGRVINSTFRNDGILGFWRGTVPTLLRNVPGVALYFAALNQIQYLTLVGWKRNIPGFSHLYDPRNNRLSNGGNLLAGAVARTAAGTILMPVTVLKVRFESAQYGGQYTGVLSALHHIYRLEGVRGLFRGVGVTALRDAPHAGLYLTFYEWLKPRMMLREDTSPVGRLMAGMTAGFLATATTQPFDLLKTKVQLAKGRTRVPRVLTEVLQKEGIRGLFNGMGPRLLRKSLSSAVTWTVYEEIFSWWRNHK